MIEMWQFWVWILFCIALSMALFAPDDFNNKK